MVEPALTARASSRSGWRGLGGKTCSQCRDLLGFDLHICDPADRTRDHGRAAAVGMPEQCGEASTRRDLDDDTVGRPLPARPPRPEAAVIVDHVDAAEAGDQHRACRSSGCALRLRPAVVRAGRHVLPARRYRAPGARESSRADARRLPGVGRRRSRSRARWRWPRKPMQPDRDRQDHAERPQRAGEQAHEVIARTLRVPRPPARAIVPIRESDDYPGQLLASATVTEAVSGHDRRSRSRRRLLPRGALQSRAAGQVPAADRRRRVSCACASGVPAASTAKPSAGSCSMGGVSPVVVADHEDVAGFGRLGRVGFGAGADDPDRAPRGRRDPEHGRDLGELVGDASSLTGARQVPRPGLARPRGQMRGAGARTRRDRHRRTAHRAPDERSPCAVFGAESRATHVDASLQDRVTELPGLGRLPGDARVVVGRKSGMERCPRRGGRLNAKSSFGWPPGLVCGAATRVAVPARPPGRAG